MALIFCKLSIAFQYFRLFRSPSIHKALIGVISFLVVYGLWAIIGTIFTCYPVQKYWDPAVEGVCLNRNAITFANAGINICSDLTLLIIPIPLLKSLQLPRRQKYVLVGVFLCGGLACTMSIIRLWSLYEIGHAAPPQQSGNDALGASAPFPFTPSFLCQELVASPSYALADHGIPNGRP